MFPITDVAWLCNAPAEDRDVQPVGNVRLAFSTREQPASGQKPPVQKIGKVPLPGGGFAQGRDQFIIELRLVRRTGAVIDRAGDKDHGIARDRKLSLAALAPELQHDLAMVADIEVGHALGARLARCIERHLHAERKTVGGRGAAEA